MAPRIERAVLRAEAASQAPHAVAHGGRQGYSRCVAVGDPQAPLSTFLEVLDLHRLLGEDGALHPGVRLVSVGDHFDWGNAADRPRATADALALLAWLAAHPPEQVVLLLGNHDLARVGELARFDPDAYEAARGEADRVYRGGHPAPEEERAFQQAYPSVAGSESLARDFSTFSVAQRDWVVTLLRARRLRLAHAVNDSALVVHAAVTGDDLRAIDVAAPLHGNAKAVAMALNAFLDDAVDRWDGVAPLDLEPLHRAEGNGQAGRGILSQRPADPRESPAEDFEGPPRRRFDPRSLPPGLTQVVGHIRDAKCRTLMPHWQGDAAGPEGRVRFLTVEGGRVHYGCAPAAGGPGAARLVFIDGGMNHVPPSRYELLDLDTLAAVGRG